MAAMLVRNVRLKRFFFTKNNSSWGVKLQYFHSFGIDDVLVSRLKDARIVKPTAIQTQAVRPVLEGRNTVINAETGSGKTLCYLLPIIHKLCVNKELISRPPYAVVLLPSIELCHQVANVFQSLTDHSMQPCVVHRDSRLKIDPKYPVIMTTPSALLTYRLSFFDSVQVVVVDEADLLIASGGNHIWEILSFFKGADTFKERRRQAKLVKHKYRKAEKNKIDNGNLGAGFSSEKLQSASNMYTTNETSLRNVAESDISEVQAERQFVFVAATLPSRGPKAAYNVLKRWLPDAEFVSTELVHHTVPTVGIFYVKVNEHLKLPELLRCLNSLVEIVKYPFGQVSKGNQSGKGANVGNDRYSRTGSSDDVDKKGIVEGESFYDPSERVKKTEDDYLDSEQSGKRGNVDNDRQYMTGSSDNVDKKGILEGESFYDPSERVKETEDDYLDSEQETTFEDGARESKSETFLEPVSFKKLRVLVFANTTTNAQRAFEFLEETTKPGKTELPWKHVTRDDETATMWESDTDDSEDDDLDRFVTKTGSKNFWPGKVGQIHKDVPIERRIETLQRFTSGKLKVLICTDLASRGLDIPDVSHVIQLDFAPNAAQVLHRTGRTARAGASGKVINFVTEDDEDLARALRACEDTSNTNGYQATFSRNRMFRRRVKAKTLPLADRL